MKIIKILSIVSLFILSVTIIFAGESLYLGKEKYDWSLIIDSAKNAKIVTTTIRGKKANLGVSISTEEEADDFTDLLLSFEDGVYDKAENYVILAEPETRAVDSPEGQMSLSLDKSASLVIKPVKSSLFYPGAVWKEAEISFWIKTVPFQDEAGLFLWKGVLNDYNTSTPQSIECSIKNQKINWRFLNTFLSPEQSKSINIISLESQTRIIPDRWYHVSLSYNYNPGILILKINNREEAILHTSPDKTESTVPYIFKLGQISKNIITIGDGFTGYMDSIKFLSKTANTDIIPVKEKVANIVTRAIEIEKETVAIDNISVVSDIPEYSSVDIEYRTSIKAAEINSKKWQPLSLFDAKQETNARFIQFKIRLTAIDKNNLPLVKNIEVKYKKIPPLLPPADITVRPIKNGVELHWLPVKQRGVGGYRVYFGTASGYYFGSGYGKDSPIETSNNYCTIEGLEPGKLYFFTITTFALEDKEKESQFSIEISARAGRF